MKIRKKFNPYFVSASFLFIVIIGWIMLFFEKGEFELLVNQHHNPFLNTFFYYTTSLGNGLFFILVLFILGFYKLFWTLSGLLSFLCISIIVQGIKFFFSEMPRPRRFFDLQGEEIQFVEGVVMHSYQTFPSGHTATVFSLFLLLSLLSRKVIWGVVCIFFAAAAGFSRVYLMQHFMIDVFFGAIIGLIVTFVVIKFCMNYPKIRESRFSKNTWQQLFTKEKPAKANTNSENLG